MARFNSLPYLVLIVIVAIVPLTAMFMALTTPMTDSFTEQSGWRSNDLPSDVSRGQRMLNDVVTYGPVGIFVAVGMAIMLKSREGR